MPQRIKDILKQQNDLNFPIADSNDLLGGAYQVKDIVERNNIPTIRRKLGMLCYVIIEKRYYILENSLSNTGWNIFNSGTSGSSIETYTHPNDGGGSISTALIGPTVISKIVVNNLGHVTSTNTRQLSKFDINLGEVTNDPQIKKNTSSTDGNIPIWNGGNGDSLSNGYSVENILAGSSYALPTSNAVKTYVDNQLETVSSGSSSKLTDPRSISMTGDVSWTTTFDGSSDVSAVSTLISTGVTAGTYNNMSTAITPLTIDVKGRVTSTGTAVTITPAWSSITSRPTTLAGYGLAQTMIDHGSITGLTDDDHKNYVLVDGTRAFTGPITCAGLIVNGDIGCSGNISSDNDISCITDFTAGRDITSGRNATIGGDIDCSGNTTVGGDIDCGSDITVSGQINCSGSTIVGGNISSSGNITSGGTFFGFDTQVTNILCRTISSLPEETELSFLQIPTCNTTPTSSNHLVNKSYVDSITTGTTEFTGEITCTGLTVNGLTNLNDNVNLTSTELSQKSIYLNSAGVDTDCGSIYFGGGTSTSGGSIYGVYIVNARGSIYSGQDVVASGKIISEGGMWDKDALNLSGNINCEEIYCNDVHGNVIYGTDSQFNSISCRTISSLPNETELSFLQIPTCDTAPTLSNHLVNKSYADSIASSNDAMKFKGIINASTSPNYPIAKLGETYKISVAGKIGGSSGLSVEIGDMIICSEDTVAGDQATVGSKWFIIQTNIDGAVTGPTISVDNKLPMFNGTSGRIIKDSGYGVETTLSSSTTLLPTSSAVKTYVDANTPTSAVKLTTPRSISMTGDVSWTTTFDGSAPVTAAGTLAASGVTAGTYNNNATSVTPLTVDAKGRVTSTGSAVTITPAWTSITSRPTTLAGYGLTQTMIDHGSITGLTDDDHTNYILVDGTRAFTATVSGITPTADDHLVTKSYVDTKVVSGEVLSAAKLTDIRSISMTGDVSWTTTFDGSTNVTAAGTLASSGVSAGTYNNNATSVTPLTVDAKGRVTATGSAVTITPAWTSITSRPTTISGYGITNAVMTNTTSTVLDSIITSWGSSSDLSIFHDATNSYINNITGSLFIKTAGKESVTLVPNGEVNLFYNNTKKIETTNTGVKVSGDVNVKDKVNITFNTTTNSLDFNFI